MVKQLMELVDLRIPLYIIHLYHTSETMYTCSYDFSKHESDYFGEINLNKLLTALTKGAIYVVN